jgi:hypothetical protein
MENNYVGDPMLINPYDHDNPCFRPALSSPAVDGTVTVCPPPDDGFFDAVCFIGGVSPYYDWTKEGWTTYACTTTDIQIIDITTNLVCNAEANVPVRVSCTATGPSGTTLYYKILYKAGYGTAAYATNSWVTALNWSTLNYADVTFPSADNYIVIVQVSDSLGVWAAGDPQGGMAVIVE